MAYPGKNHKSYQTPKRPWEKSRIEAETRLVIEYGLRNKREVWKAQDHLRKYRKAARNLLALGSRQRPQGPLRSQEGGAHQPPPACRSSRSRCEHRRCPLAQGPDPARTPSPVRRVPQGTRPVTETGPAADHPRPHRHCRQACQHPRLPCHPHGRDPDRLLRHVPARQ